MLIEIVQHADKGRLHLRIRECHCSMLLSNEFCPMVPEGDPPGQSVARQGTRSSTLAGHIDYTCPESQGNR